VPLGTSKCDPRELKQHPLQVTTPYPVMAGLDPAIHDLTFENQDVDPRDKPGDDGEWE
jgi:hypothetical protein